jgi:3-methyladenine DNA glycosylase/8-oxoguanine DNA glycosylase
MTRFTIKRPHGFRLAAATDFYSGFTPGSGMATGGNPSHAAASSSDQLTFAFGLDGSFAPVAASLREEDETIVVEASGSGDAHAIEKQLARVLGLDADGDAWMALGKKNATVGKLQNEFPGFFTAAKASPYDAATWAVIAPRMNMKQASKIKMAIARELGNAVELNGKTHHVFPSPRALAQLEKFPGLSDEKTARLRAVAEAAKNDVLDVDRLRAMSAGDALRELQKIRGVGPWAASHIYFRGAALPDALPTVEPRVLHGYADAAGVDVPSEADFEKIAVSWRPFRMWVCILLSRHLAGTDKWKSPMLQKERAVSGKALTQKLRKKERRAPTAARHE